MTRVVVTGAAGLVGYHVAEQLTRSGATVIRTARARADGMIPLDVTAPASIAALPAFDVIVNCAGLTPNTRATWAQYAAVNVDGVDALAHEALRRGAAFVQISTMGRLRGPHARGRNHYVVSKRLAERRLRSRAVAGLRVWVLRGAAMYGEHDRGNMSRLIRAIAQRRFLYPGGHQRKCFLYAGTLGEAIATGLASGALWDRPYRAEYVSHGYAVTFDDLVRSIERLTGGRGWRLPVPAPVADAALLNAMRVARVAHLRPVVDLATKARIALANVECAAPNALERLGIDPLPLEEGLRREVDWLRAARRLR